MSGLRTAMGTDAQRSPDRNRFGLTNIQVRTITICIVGPSVILWGAYSVYCAAILAFFALFMCGIEWSGLKRHLKVALLMSMENSTASAPLGDSTPPTTLQRLVNRPPPPSPYMEGVPLLPTEYALPVVPLSFYTVLKHLGWGLLAFGAFMGEEVLLVMLELYFLILVVVTLTAHNRLELKVGRAVELLGYPLSFGSPSVLQEKPSSVGNGGGGVPVAAADLETRSGQGDANHASVAGAQRNYFLLMELHMIAERQPTEQFLDFCLDIFGILWIVGLSTPMLVYSIENVGVPWLASTLVGNFINDIAALVVGRSLKVFRERYGNIYDVTGGDFPGPSGTNQLRKRPLKEASGLVRLLLRGPHHLYHAISPNKSVEGAVAGVIMNAVSFAGLMFWFYRAWFDAPARNIVNPAFQSVALWLLLGTIMGVLGVCGDLLQSLLKRVARVKDAGFIIPGHGGMLDRVDGMLLVFPFMHFALRSIMTISKDPVNRPSYFSEA
ncbi:hypothetical protein JKF63_02650 [Porcisia hertigi]|uniref:Phosphatidate cytidylyltransferase n=1 Tax=Porcisia hertigi TaxID=2761500 RepID=A0A836IK42_9TRYP|nr:hypothetical protein JKF63_02650 [Porcisia hertigi]